MRLAVILSLLLLTPPAVLANESKVTAEGESQEFATAQAMRRIPEGASVTDTSCRSQDVGMSTRYWCTVTSETRRNKSNSKPNHHLSEKINNIAFMRS